MVDTRQPPFYDDYQPEKNFHGILFKPKRVQVRELNQLQTILQDQITRMGSHLFREGSVVGEGSLSIKEQQTLIRCSYPSNFEFSDLLEGGLVLQAKVGALKANILTAKPIAGSNSAWLAIEYINTDGDERQSFSQNEQLSLIHKVAGVDVRIAALSNLESRKGFYISVLKGVYFAKGRFVLSATQNILIETPNVTCMVGFRVNEEIITEVEDPSLFSNAAGEPNYKGAGAARLKISLGLQQIAPNQKDSNFIELVLINSGIVQRKIDTSQYATLNDVLAQRTYEESGDYTVNAFPIELLDHLRSSFNPDGLYTEEKGGDETKYIARLKKGVAYVQGYRQEIQGYLDIEQPKARDVKIVNNGVSPASYGSYIIVDLVNGLPKLEIQRRHNLLKSDNTIVGSAIVRAVKRENNNRARLHLMDIRLDDGIEFGVVAKINYSISSTDRFEANLVSGVIFGGANDSMVFVLPYNTVKSLTGAGGQDVSYSVTRSWDVTLDSTGAASVSLTGSEIFSTINQYDYFAAISSSNVQLPISGLALGGSPIGKLLTLSYGNVNAGSVVRVIATVIKTNPSIKTKLLKNSTQNVTFNDVNAVKLNYADIYGILEVIDLETGANVTESYSFFDGQRPNWYENGQLIHKNGLVIANLKVTYAYFEHSVSGDFFCADSYVDLDRKDVPFTKESSGRQTTSLSDCIDFRLIRSLSGDYNNAPNVFDVIQPNDNIRFDLTYYLPRIDTVFLTSEGKFNIKLGVSSDTPVAPVIPDNAMELYHLYVPAYTEDCNQIVPKQVENQRFTMKDIGALEKRIQNVEYYVNLSQLESKTERTQVLDPITGNNRYKNGFAADGFSDFRLLDILDKEWDASIDLSEGKVLPSFTQNGINMNYLSGAKRGNSAVTLPFTVVKLTEQPYATEVVNANPFASFDWDGTVKLSPSSDFWKDTIYNPPIVVNVNDSLSEGNYAGADKLSEVLGRSLWSKAYASKTQLVNPQVQSSSQLNVNSEQESVRVIPFVRPQSIQFNLTNFKPLTRLYPFFAGISVGSVCSQVGKSLGEPIVTDINGSANGTFEIPALGDFRFKNGLNVLSFYDTEDGKNTSTKGETIFLSGDQNMLSDDTFTVTKTLRPAISKMVSSDSPISRDPIAQTFRVGTSGGAFVNSVKLFFKSKSTNSPVTLQIRNVQNGIPTGEVLTFAEKTLLPSEVKVSDNGLLATEFVFDDLVFLQENAEYAIVVIANSTDYNLFISRMGGVDISSNFIVAKQPHTGVLLVSSNGSTWTPNQLDDLKFTVTGAFFNTNPVELVLRSNATEYQSLNFNPFETVAGSKIIKVYQRGHGLRAGDYTEFSSAQTGNGINADALNKSIRISTATLDSFTFDCGTQAVISGTFGGSTVQFKPNYTFTNVNPRVNSLILDGCTVESRIGYTSQSDRSPANLVKVELNRINDLAKEGVNTISNKVDMRLLMASNNPNLSPMIDLHGAGIESIGKRINVDDSKPAFVVVTKSLKFDNPSTLAKVYLVAKLPFGCDMKLYYKPIFSGDDNLSMKDWVALQPKSALQNSNNQFYESEWDIKNIGTFIGYKLKVVMLGADPIFSPELTELRTIALA